MGEPFEYVDVTSRFRSAFRSLPEGKLIALPSFSLLESMSAVQLMDKKLDSGMTLMTVPTLSKRLETGQLQREISPQDQVTILDELLFRTAQWLEGESLVSTILSCLHMHEPSLYAGMPVLKAVFEALFSIVEVVNFLTAKSTCLRDDDVSYSFCRVPHEVKAVQEIEGTFRSAELWAGRTHPPLLSRLQVFHGLMQIADSLKKADCAGFPDFDRWLQSTESGLSELKKTHQDADSTAFFDLDFALRYVNNFPAHKIPTSVTYTFDMAFSRLEKLLSGVRHIKSLQQCKDVDDLVAGINGLPSWDVLSRIALDFQLFSSTEPIRVLNGRTLSELIHGSMTKTGFDLKTGLTNEYFLAFSQRVELVLKELIRMRLKNQTRQRRSIWKHFPDLTILLSESEYAERPGKKGKGPLLFNWMFKRLTSYMIEFLQQGFALELYSPGEVGMVLFYEDYLLGLHVSCLENIAKSVASQKKSRKPKTDQSEMSLTQALQLISRGTVRLFVILNKHQAIPVSYSDAQQRILFQKRFRYFDYIQVPSKLDYSSYQTVAVVPEGADERYSAACQECFDAAKTLLSQLPQAPTGLIRLCIANSLAVTIGSRALWKVKVEFLYKEHPCFPTVKLTPIST